MPRTISAYGSHWISDLLMGVISGFSKIFTGSRFSNFLRSHFWLPTLSSIKKNRSVTKTKDDGETKLSSNASTTRLFPPPAYDDNLNNTIYEAGYPMPCAANFQNPPFEISPEEWYGSEDALQSFSYAHSPPIPVFDFTTPQVLQAIDYNRNPSSNDTNNNDTNNNVNDNQSNIANTLSYYQGTNKHMNESCIFRQRHGLPVQSTDHLIAVGPTNEMDDFRSLDKYGPSSVLVPDDLHMAALDQDPGPLVSMSESPESLLSDDNYGISSTNTASISPPLPGLLFKEENNASVCNPNQDFQEPEASLYQFQYDVSGEYSGLVLCPDQSGYSASTGQQLFARTQSHIEESALQFAEQEYSNSASALNSTPVAFSSTQVNGRECEGCALLDSADPNLPVFSGDMCNSSMCHGLSTTSQPSFDQNLKGRVAEATAAGVMSSILRFQCPHCKAAFRLRGYLTRHIKKHAAQKAYTCPFFDRDGKSRCHPSGGFSRKDTFKTHLKTRHFEYREGTIAKDRDLVNGACRGCRQKFDNNKQWISEHVMTLKCPAICNFQISASSSSGSKPRTTSTDKKQTALVAEARVQTAHNKLPLALTPFSGDPGLKDLYHGFCIIEPAQSS